VWYRTYFGKRAVRVTMLAKQCDATIGLPDSDDFMGPKVIFSKPLFNLGYAIVAPKEESIASVEELKGKRVAVQFETEPHNIVGPRDDIEAVTVLSPDAGMKALADGRAGAAFLWAPTASYLNKTTYDGRFAVVPVDGPRLTYPAAIAYAKPSVVLRDAIDAILPEVSKAFPVLLAKYGLGPEAPVAPAAADKPSPVAKAAPAEKAALVVAQAAPTAPAASSPPEPAAPAAPATAPAALSATPELIAAGKEVFNSSCAHCHGPDAVQAVKKIDLRRLTLRYGDRAHDMYWKTVNEGRPAKGMPTWKDVFSDEQLAAIFAFLSTIQSTE
jgi:polar amino acid transport system substrate-binding protein